MTGREITCFCSGHCPAPYGLNSTCLLKSGGYCYAFVQEVIDVKTNRYEAEWSYGCFPPEESGFMQCKSDMSPHKIPRSIKCCSDRDLCNLELKPYYISQYSAPGAGPGLSDSNMDKLIFIVPFSIVVLALLLLLLIVAKWRRDKKGSTGSRSDSSQSSMVDTESNMSIDGYDAYGGSSHSNDKSMYGDVSSIREITNSSGAGVPLLVQRTIARQLTMIKIIGGGRYGDVLLAKWRGDDVAVKIFKTTEEASWKREHDVYNSVLLRHENLLGFIASDIRGTGGCTQMLLITEYHPRGSLYDYLRLHILDELTALKLMHSAISGLSHLHQEIIGKEGKQAIAHRDIKSKNILVKTDGECCIADFGLCVLFDPSTQSLNVAENTRVGTKRYMAPEVLDESLNRHDFESYKRSDIYSFSLVLWEIARRCTTSGVVDEYQLPYQGLVPNDPSFDEMKKLICEDWVRPEISERWFENPYMKSVIKLMIEGWSGSPKVRPTARKMKKDLKYLYRKVLEEKSGLESDQILLKTHLTHGLIHTRSSSSSPHDYSNSSFGGKSSSSSGISRGKKDSGFSSSSVGSCSSSSSSSGLSATSPYKPSSLIVNPNPLAKDSSLIPATTPIHNSHHIHTVV